MTATNNPQDGRPWVRADWRYVDKLPSISVGSPDTGKAEKQAADSARATARWSRENHIGNEWTAHKRAKLEADAATIKAENSESIGGQLLAMGRISARAMQRRALSRGIVLSDTAVADAAADATLTAWRSWCAIQTARRQPLFTPPVGGQAQFWQWRRWLRKLVRRVVSRSFSGKSFGQVQDNAEACSHMPWVFDSLEHMADCIKSNPQPIALSADTLEPRLINSVSDKLTPAGLELVAKAVSGKRLTDRELNTLRQSHYRRTGKNVPLGRERQAHIGAISRLRSRVRGLALERLAIKPISKVTPHGRGPIGATRKVCYSPASPVWWFRYLDRKSALSAWRHAITCRQYSLAMAIADCVV